MARTHTSDFGRYAFREIAASTSPAALEQFKLERLFELRAVIEALRSEQSPGDPHPGAGRDSRARQ